jgi:hypothetical protein
VIRSLSPLRDKERCEPPADNASAEKLLTNVDFDEILEDCISQPNDESERSIENATGSSDDRTFETELIIASSVAGCSEGLNAKDRSFNSTEVSGSLLSVFMLQSIYCWKIFCTLFE